MYFLGNKRKKPIYLVYVFQTFSVIYKCAVKLYTRIYQKELSYPISRINSDSVKRKQFCIAATNS